MQPQDVARRDFDANTSTENLSKAKKKLPTNRNVSFEKHSLKANLSPLKFEPLMMRFEEK
jgi:hypothetical protein